MQLDETQLPFLSGRVQKASSTTVKIALFSVFPKFCYLGLENVNKNKEGTKNLNHVENIPQTNLDNHFT